MNGKVLINVIIILNNLALIKIDRKWISVKLKCYGLIWQEVNYILSQWHKSPQRIIKKLQDLLVKHPQISFCRYTCSIGFGRQGAAHTWCSLCSVRGPETFKCTAIFILITPVHHHNNTHQSELSVSNVFTWVLLKIISVYYIQYNLCHTVSCVSRLT